MHSLLIFFFLIVNLVISWLNCRAVGSIWREAAILGGFPRLLAWCGAIQAAIGFSSVVLFLSVMGAAAMHWLPPAILGRVVSLWYLMVVIPAIGTGLIITVQSWVVAFRDRSVANFGVAGYNTLAMASNIYDAFRLIPSSLSDLSGLFSDDSEEGDSMAALVIMLALAAVLSGVLIAGVLIRHYASYEPHWDTATA